jgi:glucose/mannose-6-phosphate isomerase
VPQLDETRIDDEAAIERLDRRHTLRALATAGAQVRHAVELAADAGVARLRRTERPRSVLVAAVGTASTVPDVLELLAEPGSPVPVSTRHDLPLPGWVGPLDLVVAVSHSGRAAGPLALAAEAARRGAEIVTVGTADSPLADVCARARGLHVAVPPDLTSTRTSLWSLLTPVLVAADALGLVAAPPALLSEVADRLDAAALAARPGSESFVNPAKLLAVDLAERFPVVLGDGAVAGVAARRAATMLNRTARVPAMWGELPDAAAQVVALLDGPYTDAGAAALAGEGEVVADIFRDPYLDGMPDPRLGLVLLRESAERAAEGGTEVGRPLAATVAEIARAAGVRVSEYAAEPGPVLVRLADLVAHVDFAATYLALGLGLDPALSPHLAELRDRTR